ncbi:sulfotransferase 2A1-like [Lissotriton helveticus]
MISENMGGVGGFRCGLSCSSRKFQTASRALVRAERKMARLDVTETFAGVNFPGELHTLESLERARNFDFQVNDIVIVTYPKSGTTWMQEVLTLIYSKGDADLAKTIPNWVRAPWLEHTYFPDVLTYGGGPRFITSHLQYEILGPALKRSKAKVIYVTRNPKDVAVSFYHFHKMAKFLPDPGSFEEFLKKFLEGTVHFGSWFEHVKGWWSHREEIKFLHMSYEDMKKDLRHSIERVCKFLSCPMYQEELEGIEKHCTFTTMSQNSMVNCTLIAPEILDHNQGKFMRKGNVGDWKENFTLEQNAHFDEVYKEKMQDLDIIFQWELD